MTLSNTSVNPAPAAEVIVVTSGKGGVGKTTTSAALATGLAALGHKTVVIDFDVGLRNLDLIMGCERRVVFDLVNVIKREANLKQTLIKDRRIDCLFILPASQTRDKDALKEERIYDIIEELRKEFTYIICDSPAGIEKGALMAMRFADRAIIVTNPEISSVRDSDRIIGILASKTAKAELGLPLPAHLLLTRYDPVRVTQGHMLSLEDVQEILALPLLGVIPESHTVLQASNTGVPVVLNKESDAGIAYHEAIQRLLGNTTAPIRISAPKRNLFQRLLGLLK